MGMSETGYPWPIETTRLDNGLRVVVSEDRTAPVVAVNLWYDVGSRHEPPGQTGFAHLFEHLMFEGSVNVAKTEHMRLVQGAGGSLNATTNPDRTNYFETMPAEHLATALWLEADRMGGLVPALTQETLDNQREVVKNERRQRYDNVPYGDAWLRLLPLLYPPGHPYHHATIGSMEDLNAASLATFQDFHSTYYAPNNAVLTVVGDTDAAEVFALATALLRRAARRAPTSRPRRTAGRCRPRAYRRGRRSPPTCRPPRIYLAHRTHPFGSRGYDVVTVLATILGSGRGSRLYQRLADGARLAQPDLVGGVRGGPRARPRTADRHRHRPSRRRRRAAGGGAGRGGRRDRHRRRDRRRAGAGAGAADHRLVAAARHGGRPGRHARPVRHPVRRPGPRR